MRCVYSVACTSPDTLYVLQISYRTQSTAVHIIPVRLYDSALLWVLLSGTGIAAIFIVFDLYDNLTHIHHRDAREPATERGDVIRARSLSLSKTSSRPFTRAKSARGSLVTRSLTRGIRDTHTHTRTHTQGGTLNLKSKEQTRTNLRYWSAVVAPSSPHGCNDGGPRTPPAEAWGVRSEGGQIQTMNR